MDVSDCIRKILCGDDSFVTLFAPLLEENSLQKQKLNSDGRCTDIQIKKWQVGRRQMHYITEGKQC